MPVQNETSWNHFVSQFTSRPWLMGSNQFYELTVDDERVHAKPTGPKKWGAEEDLYSQAVEKAFSRIENLIAPLQLRLECGIPPSTEERFAWSMWLLSCYLRTPAAFLCSADVGSITSLFVGDLFKAGYAMLADCATNPHCIDLIAQRDWQILTCDKPFFLKPDSGVILTDRLDNPDCLILYPFSPFTCFLATGNQLSFRRVSIQKRRVFGLNKHLLQWSDKSVICTNSFWEKGRFMLENQVHSNLAKGKYLPPRSGRFYSLETIITG